MTASARQCEQCDSALAGGERPGSRRKAATLCGRCIKARSIKRAAERYTAEIAKTGRPPLRSCKKCGDTVAARTGSWPMSNSAPSGRLCLPCHSERQELVDARAAAKRRASPAGQLQSITARVRDLQQRASLLGPDGDVAVRLGAQVLNEEAEGVAEKLAEAVEDPAHEFHREALAFLASRILPLKVYGEAAVRLARSGGIAATSDTPASLVTVNVKTTTGPKW